MQTTFADPGQGIAYGNSEQGNEPAVNISKRNYLTAEKINISYKEFYLFSQLNLVIDTQT